MNLLGAPSPKESAASLREWARSLGREGFRAGVTLLLCVIVIVAGAVVVLLTWARTDVVSVEVSVAVIVLSAWFGLLLVAFGSGMLLGRRVSIIKIVSIVLATGVVALVGAVALRQFDWTIRLTAFWVALLLAIVVAGYLLSDQVGKASVRTFSLLGLVILGLLLITIGRNERVNLAARAAESAYLQLDQIRDQGGEATAASDVLVWKLCELGESSDCGDEPEVSGGAELGSCLPGWTYQAFEEWTQAASIDREVAATAALARCELRAFDPGSLADDDPQSDVVPVVESGVEAQADPDAANDIVEAEAQTQAAVDARLAVADAISTQRSRANLIETLADGADGILSSISGPNEFAEFRFSGATWLVLLALGLLWYRQLEIRSGGHGLGPVEIVYEDNPSPGDASATSAGGDVGALRSSQAVFKQAVVQNVPEPGAVPGAQALAPVGDLISSTDAPNKWVAAGVVDAVRTILATRSGYTVMYSAHQEPNLTRRGDDTAGGSTSVVFVRIRDTQNGAQKASMRFESEYAEEAAQMAGYWVAGWIISRSRYVPEWAVWSERDAHAFYSLQWRQGDDLPLQAHGIVDPNRIQAPVNALILTQRAYAYQISPKVRKNPDSAGPYTFNALEDFARAAYHQPRYPVARYRRAVALSSLMHEGVELDRVFLPRSNNEAVGRPSRTRLLHLFRDLIGYGFTVEADRVRLEGWIEEVESTGVFPVEMRDTMLKLADGWLVEAQQSVRAGFLAQLRPSERRFWREFSRTGTRQDWTTLVQVSQQIVKVRLNRTGSTCRIEDEMAKDITDRARASDSHWQISYNIGCYHSLRAEQETDDAQKKLHCDRAFDWLERCLDRPYNGQLVREWIERDPDLHAIRVGDPAAFQRWRLRVPRMPVQIRNGDRSSAVKRLQQRLNLVAGPGKRDQLKTDGYFGDVTAQAVEEFQYLHDLRVSGKPDLTMLALLETLAEEHGEAIADSPADDEHTPSPPRISMPTTFEAATAVVPRGHDAAGRGQYDVELVTEYSIMGTKPNGGYMLACLGRAALHAAREAGSTHEHVISASAQFLASPDLGPAQIVTEVDRVGKTASQVSATIGVDGVLGVRAQFTLGTLQEGTAPFWGEVVPCTFPALDDLPPSPMAGERGNSLQFDPAAGFTMTPDGPVANGGGEFRAYLRDEVDDRFDSVGLLYASDVMPPATFGVVQTGWVPTLAITVYNRAVPAPGPLRLRFRVQVIHDGYADEVCEAWDSEDRLVMQSTQMTALRIPPDATPLPDAQ